MKNINDTTERQLRREAELTLADEVSMLLRRDEQEGLRWKGSRTDLMEALHVAYTTGNVTDDCGRCLTFTRIVSRACRVLHAPAPRNPYHRAARGRERKGILCRSYMERYLYMLRNGRNSRPLATDILQQ